MSKKPTYRQELRDARDAIDALLGPPIIPWVETNTPNAENIKKTLAGIRAWSPHCEEAIVTTHPNYWTQLYPQLASKSPLGIIGGIKTLDVAEDYADAAGWRLIAAISGAIARVTGSHIIVLDSEASLQAAPRVGMRDLRASLGELRRTGLEYWFYLPHIQPGDDHAYTTQLVETIHEALPTARFTLGKSGTFDGLDDPGQLALREDMRLATDGQTCELLYVTPDGMIGSQRVFTVAELQEHLPRRGAGHNIVYPGWANWLWAAEVWE